MNKTLQFKKPLLAGVIVSIILTSIFFLTESPILVAVILIIALVATIILILLIIEIISKRKTIGREKIVYAVVISSISLPIVFILIFVGVHFAQSTRIDIINNTDQTIERWEISGCESLWRDNHYPKKREIIWLDLTGDCSVQIEYSQQGNIKKETIVGNLKPGLFSRVEFYIQP